MLTKEQQTLDHTDQGWDSSFTNYQLCVHGQHKSESEIQICEVRILTLPSEDFVRQAPAAQCTEHFVSVYAHVCVLFLFLWGAKGIDMNKHYFPSQVT